MRKNLFDLVSVAVCPIVELSLKFDEMLLLASENVVKMRQSWMEYFGRRSKLGVSPRFELEMNSWIGTRKVSKRLDLGVEAVGLDVRCHECVG